MDIDYDRYRLIEYRDNRKNKYLPETLEDTLELLWIRLKQIRAESLFSQGTFITTYNRFKDEFVIKRYVIEVQIPHTIFEIRKCDKGSIDTEWFMEILENKKEML